MEQISYIFKYDNLTLIISFFLFYLLVRLIRKIYKVLVLFRLNFLGKLGKKKAKILLISNGYEILEEQPTIKGKLLENQKITSFYVKPDFLVKKNNLFR